MKIRASQAPTLRNSIILSAIFHLAAVVSLVTVPGIYLPFREKPMRIDVTWVELPRGSSDEIGLGVKQAEGLPKSTIEEQQKIFQPEQQPVQKTLAPEMKAPPEKPLEAKATPEKRPQIDVSKMKKTDESLKPVARPVTKTDRQIKNALAAIDKQLSGRQVVPESGQVDKNQDGYKYGTSNKPLKVLPSDPEYLKYQAMVRAKIMREWVVPTVYVEGGKRLSARLEVMINLDGDVTSTRWVSSSGNPSFDQSAVRAVKNASPLPRPPDRLAWEANNEGFLIEFAPRLPPPQ